MQRPVWVPKPTWVRLEAVLAARPEQAEEALSDLSELTRTWDEPTRVRMLAAFEKYALCGHPPIAAMIRALSDLLESDG